MSTQKPPTTRSRLKNVTLFSEEDDVILKPQTTPLDKIKLPKQQPRRYFSPEKLAGLVESIKQHGILEPLLVRTSGASDYELIAGERRYRAAKEIGLLEVPIVIHDMSDTEALQVALIENLQREDLNPVEETEGILQLLAIKLEKTEPEVISLLHRMLDEAKGKVPHNVMGNSDTTQIQQVFEGIALMEWQSFVTNRLPLLKLPGDILLALREGSIAYTKAQAIARLKDDQTRQELLQDAIVQNLSLTQIKERLKALTATAEKQPTLSDRLVSVSRKVKQGLNDPKKQRRLEKLLQEMEILVES